MNKLVNTHFHNKRLTIVLIILGGLFLHPRLEAQVWSLQQCLDTAKHQNKIFLMARNNIEIGQQKVQEAKANLIPKLSINADYRYYVELPYQFMPESAFGGPEGQFKEVQFGVPHNINANLQLMQCPLYNPQVHGALSKPQKLLSKLSLQYQKSEEQILYDVTTLYYNAQILHYQITFIDENLINAQ
jgi:outer membrane protein TolC